MRAAIVASAKQNLTPSQEREWNALRKTTDRMWRKFWVGVLHAQGKSNRQIAKDLGLSESTVRTDLKK